jgi:hypothetical protein
VRTIIDVVDGCRDVKRFHESSAVSAARGSLARFGSLECRQLATGG